MGDLPLELTCELLVFLDRRGELQNMGQETEMFILSLDERNVHSFPPFCYTLLIDVMELIDHCGALGEMLMREPGRLREMCGDVLHSCLQTVNERTDRRADGVARCQLDVTLRLKCLPTSMVVPNLHHYSGLSAIRGLLTAITKPFSYITYSVWTCPEACEGNEVVLHHLPKHAPKCYQCKSTLFENSRLRRCGDRVIATLHVKGDILPRLVSVPEDLIQDLILGTEYHVAGVVFRTRFHAWSLECINFATTRHVDMPPSIEQLYKECHGIGWKFIYHLASYLGSEVCPKHTFMHLKISLLLSIASLKFNVAAQYKEGPDMAPDSHVVFVMTVDMNGGGDSLNGSLVHVLCADADTGYVPRIMAEATKFVGRVVFVGGSNATVADSLLASSNGLCVLPLPIQTYPQKFMNSLLAAMEKKEVPLKESVRLTSAVWAHGGDKKKFLLCNVASIFGTTCQGDYDDESLDLADMLLERAVDGASGPSRDEARVQKALKLYLERVQTLEVVMEPEAEELLKLYFLAARKNEQGDVNVMTAHALACLCVAAARVCGRRAATADDALLAVWLHDTGAPQPHLSFQKPADIAQWEQVMEEFKMQLSEFIGRVLDVEGI